MAYLLLVPLALSLLLLLAAHFGLHNLKVDSVVHVDNVLGVFTTTFLALLLQSIFAKRSKVHDAEKELVNGHITDVSSSVKEIKNPIKAASGRKPSSIEAQKIVEAFEASSEEFATLETVIENSHCSQLVEDCKEISDLLIKYKAEVTGENFPDRIIGPGDIERAAVLQREIARRLQLFALAVNQR